MPYQTNKTYCLAFGQFCQSNGQGKALASSVPNSGVYASFSGLTDSYELRGASANSVKVYFNNTWTEATLGNFAVNVDVHKSLDLAEKNIRSTSTIGYWMSLVKEMRSDLDSAGNNNDLLVYATSLGGMSARATVDAYDLSVDTGEHYRYTMQGFINQILKNPDITNPYPIMLWRQGESDNEDISETEVEYNKWLSENRALFGYDVPVVIIPPLWSRTDIIALQNKIISENNHVISGFGADLDDFQAETVSQHNATGVGTTIDPSDSATFTIDGLHFNYAVLIQDGIIAAPALESLGSGYAY